MALGHSNRNRAWAVLIALIGVVCLMAMVASLFVTIRCFDIAWGKAEDFGVLLATFMQPVTALFGVLTLAFMMGFFISLDLYMAATRSDRER